MKIGITCSTFDLLHAGHILMLEESKRNCDYLIVCLQTDPTIDRPEKNKPIQSIFERYTQLKAVKYVDEIIVYETEKDLQNIFLSTNANLRFIGEDYKDKDFTAKDICLNRGIDIFYNSRGHSFSSTELRGRIRS
jgi:glycerol-3-phosphate cytidylyltransferase